MKGKQVLVLLIFGLFELQILRSQSVEQQPKVELQTFTYSDFPEDIVGAGCYCVFSKSDKDLKIDRFFFVKDYDENAYIKIKNQFVKLILINKDNDSNLENKFYLYKAPNFKIRFDIIKTKASTIYDEASDYYGKVTLIFLNGEKQFFNFVGLCGC